jgi:hypothetical protein
MNRISFADNHTRPLQLFLQKSEMLCVCSQDLNGNYIAGPQLATELPNQPCPALSKLLELNLKLSDEGASRTIRRKLPVFFATNIELDEGSAHQLFTKAEICG